MRPEVSISLVIFLLLFLCFIVYRLIDISIISSVNNVFLSIFVGCLASKCEAIFTS